MDDEDARRLLDIIGDEQALNDYLHGPNSKSINEDDVTNTTFGSANSFFISNSGDTGSALKDVGSTLGGVGGADGVGLQLPSSLRFISEEMGEASPSGAELGEEQPFDILQKSLLEADITEQTLAQEALLESPPPSAPFAQQLASGGFGGATGAGPSPLPFPGAQAQGLLQQVSQQPLHNGSAGHIQVLGAFGGSPSVMTINNIERPQIILRPGGGVGAAGGGQGGVFAPAAMGQLGVPFKACGTSIPFQNIIFQRGPSPQGLVRPIQPKPLQVGGQTVYNISGLGLQGPPNATPPNHTGNFVIHSPLGQQQQQQTGQFLLPASLSLTPTSSTHSLQALNGQILQTSNSASVSTTTYSILTNHNSAMQLVAGQSFQGQLIVNQGAVPGSVGQQVAQVSQATGGMAKVWPGGGVQNRFHLVSSTGSQALEGGATGPQGQQQVSVSLVPFKQDPAPGTNAVAESYAFSGSQDSSSAAPQFINMPGNKTFNTVTPISQVDSTSTANTQLGSQKRPASQQLTKGILVLQQLRRDQAKVLASDRPPFSSLEDAVHQLLPYHVYQGALPNDEDFKKVDEEFETAATHVLKRTQSMVDKYRRLLVVESERTNPSSELVMIDRTFNQEERNDLTRDKRLALVDPDGFLEDFCCLAKPECVSSAGLETGSTAVTELQGASPRLPRAERHRGDPKDLGGVRVDENGRGGANAALRTEPPRPGCKDPAREGPEVSLSEHLETAIKNILHLKRTQGGGYVSHASASATPSSVPRPAHLPPQRRGPDKPVPLEHIQPPTVAHTDSVLEAAVNSILEC